MSSEIRKYNRMGLNRNRAGLCGRRGCAVRLAASPKLYRYRGRPALCCASCARPGYKEWAEVHELEVLAILARECSTT